MRQELIGQHEDRSVRLWSRRPRSSCWLIKLTCCELAARCWRSTKLAKVRTALASTDTRARERADWETPIEASVQTRRDFSRRVYFRINGQRS